MGYRNILIEPLLIPPDGFSAGTVVDVNVSTQYAGAPLPDMPFIATIIRPNPVDLAHPIRDQWLFKTDNIGVAHVTYPIISSWPTGPYTLMAVLMKALPDGTWDADGWTFQVVGSAL